MSVSFQTNKTGAAATVCTTSTIKYNFSVAQNTTADFATFAMGKGSSTTAGCTVAIYNQPNGGGSVVGSVTLPASAFTSGGGYPDVVFTFPANTNLTANSDYSLVISSSTGCNGANAYSLKPGSFQVLDTATNQVLNTGYAIVAPVTANTTFTATSRASFVASVSPISVTSFSADMAVNKNYEVTAAAAVDAHFDAALSVDTSIAAAAKACPYTSAAASCDYSTAADSISRAWMFASTEPYLFIESVITSNTTFATEAVQEIGAGATLSAECSFASAITQDNGIVAELISSTELLVAAVQDNSATAAALVEAGLISTADQDHDAIAAALVDAGLISTADQDHSAQATALNVTETIAAITQNNSIYATLLNESALTADATLSPADLIAFYAGENPVGRLYIGPILIVKAYIGPNLLLDTPN